MADEAPIEAVAEVVVDRVIPVGPIDEAIEEVIKVGVNDVAWSFNLSLESETLLALGVNSGAQYLLRCMFILSLVLFVVIMGAWYLRGRRVPRNRPFVEL